MLRTRHPYIFKSLICAAALALPITMFASSHNKVDQEISLLKKQNYMMKKQNAALNSQVRHLNYKMNRLTAVVYNKPGHSKAEVVANGDMKSPNYQPMMTNHALYIRHNFPYFYWVITQNDPKSYANRDLCIKGMICFSGWANMDVRFTDRSGSGIQPGSTLGVGVRPLFSDTKLNLIGSIRNMNLFVDGAINNWVRVHFDFAYVNASAQVATYYDSQRDDQTVFNSAAALHVNLAYLLFADPAKMPFFFQVGRVNAPFGQYEPFAMIPKLTDLIEEARTGGFIAGAAFRNGLYAEAGWFMARQSLNDLSSLAFPLEFFGFPVNSRNSDRNYGGKIGFRQDFLNDQLHVDSSVSWIADIRDSDYFQAGYELYNVSYKDSVFLGFFNNTYIVMYRAPAASAHLSLQYKRFGFDADYVGATKSLNPYGTNSQIWAYSFQGSMKFMMFTLPTKVYAGYQRSGNANIFRRITVPPNAQPTLPIPIGTILPRYRWTAGAIVNILPWVNLGIQWAHDKDYGPVVGSTGRSSNLVVGRISAQL